MTLLDLAAQAEDEAVRRAALQRAELLGRMWHRAFPTLRRIAGKKAWGLRQQGRKRGRGEEGEEGEGGPEEGWAVSRLVGKDKAAKAAVRAQLVSLEEGEEGEGGDMMEAEAEVRLGGGVGGG